MKAIKILFLSIFLIFLVNTVSAVVVYGEWDSNQAQSISIEDGESADFSAFFGTIYPPMTISIKFYYSNNDLIHTFEDTEVNQKTFSQTYTVNQAIYSRPGDYEVRISGSDNYGDMSHILYLDVINYPPEITSTPVTEVEENELYSYDVEATDPDNHHLTYSLSTAPSWLSIDFETGLITGTAPDVIQDTDFNVEVVVSDGIDTDTQSYVLTVIWVPNPSLTQTVERVNYIYADYYATLSELDSAILNIYYKAPGSNDYDPNPIATRNINAPSYSETFDFYNIHNKTKGNYSFVLEAVGYNLSETEEINIPDYAPEVDLGSVSANFDEENSIEITLPNPTDTNPEDEPVAYLSAVSLNGKTTANLNGNILTITGNRDKIGNYSIELEFGQGVTGSAILSGYIYNLPDISGILENNENDGGIQGIIRVYYINPDNSSDHIPLEIDKINDEEGSIINKSLGKIETIVDGTFSFQINERASDLDEIVLQARIGTAENYTGYVRTITFDSDDNIDILVRAVPYAGLDENGISVEDFKRHAQEVLTKEDDPPEDVNPWIFKWNFGENPNSSSLFNEVIISKQNPYEPEVFPISQTTAYELKNRILNSSDIGSGFDGKINNTLQVKIEDNWTIEEPKDHGRIIIYPSISNNAIAHDRDRDGYIDIAVVNLITNSEGNFSGSGRAPAHEIFHVAGMYGHTQIFNSTQSIMGAVAVPGVPITPRFADMKLAKAIHEDTYQHGIGMENWLRLESVLGLGFYGESYITGTFNEDYFEPEGDEDDNDFTGNQKNEESSTSRRSGSHRDNMISDNFDSFNNNGNTDIPYDTIYLQSNENKKNILTSLSNIIRQVISFIKSMFSI